MGFQTSMCALGQPINAFKQVPRPFDITMMDLVLAWQGRHASSPLWRYMIIQPLSSMTELAGMQQLYYQSCENGVDPSEFDPVVDNKLFMRKATPVMHFILANKDIFKKAFIAFSPQDECDVSSCCIAMNAGDIKSDNPTDFGFVHFCPKVKLDNGCEHSPAYAVLSCVKEPPLLSTKKQKKSVKDDSISPWFGSITKFHNLLKDEVKYTFGCQLGNFESSVNQILFERAQLQQQYALL